MGLWLARKLWDHVDLLPGSHGLTVRLSTRLRSPIPVTEDPRSTRVP
jgi:hypothetical protein